ncbi:TonB family protein [Piscinibacter sp.]|uniref:TonB family protein n=1 Tax=Piscinibacter sp. TaxID=1903157 RepID=UPI0039E27BC2
MNFGQRQRDPTKHFVGIAAVILFHGFVIYALMTGLAKKVIEVVRAPIETKVIEEVKKPPPPPEVLLPPPPKLEAPPPPFIPPPEVQIATPPPPQPTITAVTPTPPPEPVVIAPAPPPVAAPAPPAPAAPAVVSAGVVCPGYQERVKEAGYPREANRAGLTRGEALIEFSVGAGGEVKNPRVISSTHPIFGRYAARQVQEIKCVGQGHEVPAVRIPFTFKLD